MILFFDTETNGKPLDYKAPMTMVNNWPRVIQLGWALYSDDGEELGHKCSLIKPDGWVVPKEDFWIRNGYSTEKNEAEGIPIKIALADFRDAAWTAHTMAAHNMAFDNPILGAEMIRIGMKVGKKLQKICTMEAGTDFCKLPAKGNSNGGGYRWPSLTGLHTILFGKSFDGAHDALADVRACARCFFGLKEKGLIPVSL